jgi:hypothetical protein
MDLTRAVVQKYFSKPDQQYTILPPGILLKRQGLNGTLVAGVGVA